MAFLGLWTIVLTILVVSLPLSLQWPFLAWTLGIFFASLVPTCLLYKVQKSRFIKKNQPVLASIMDSIGYYREKGDRKAQSYSRQSVIAAFPEECRDFVEYALDHETCTHNEYRELRSLDSARNQLQEKDRALRILREELDDSKRQFAAVTKSQVKNFVLVIAKTRREPRPIVGPRSGRMVTDLVFHELYLEPHLVALLRHPIVDRLRSVKQLSFTYQEQPTALHSRLTHSLGVAKNTEFALQRIFERGKLYVIESRPVHRWDEASRRPTLVTPGRGHVEPLDIDHDLAHELIRIGKTAALLHDIGHAPFGHALDRFIMAKLCRDRKSTADKTDKHYSSQYVRSILAATLDSYGVNADALAYIISRRPEYYREVKDEPWAIYLDLIASIIDSDLDADRIDFLVRDSHSTGLPYGLINSTALLSSMLPTVESEGGRTSYATAYDGSSVGFIEHAVTGRIKMYENCYESEVKIASETMLTNALRYFLETSDFVEVEDLLLLTDDELLALILANSPIASPEHRLVELLVRQQCFSCVVEPIALKKEWRGYRSLECDRYLDRANDEDFPVQAYEIPLGWQEYLTRRLPEEDRWMVQVYATPYDRFAIKEQQIRLIRVEDDSFELFTLADAESAKDLIQLLAERTERSPRVEVFAHSELRQAELADIRKAVKDLFGS